MYVAAACEWLIRACALMSSCTVVPNKVLGKHIYTQFNDITQPTV